MQNIASPSLRLGKILWVIAAIAAAAIWTAAPAIAETYQVKMGTDNGQLAFDPPEIAIAPGDTVQFVMNGLGPHNVVFNARQVPGKDRRLAKQLSAPKLVYSADGSLEVEFPANAEPGEYGYYCQPHRGAGMSGKIIVELVE